MHILNSLYPLEDRSAKNVFEIISNHPDFIETKKPPIWQYVVEFALDKLIEKNAIKNLFSEQFREEELNKLPAKLLGIICSLIEEEENREKISEFIVEEENGETASKSIVNTTNAIIDKIIFINGNNLNDTSFRKISTLLYLLSCRKEIEAEEVFDFLFTTVGWSTVKTISPPKKFIEALLNKLPAGDLLTYALNILASDDGIEKKFSYCFSQGELRNIKREVLNVVCSLINKGTVSSFKIRDTLSFIDCIIAVNLEKLQAATFYQENVMLLLLKNIESLRDSDAFDFIFYLVGWAQITKKLPPQNLINALLEFSVPDSVPEDSFVSDNSSILNFLSYSLETLASKNKIEKDFSKHFSPLQLKNTIGEVLKIVCSLIDKKTTSQFRLNKEIPLIKFIFSINSLILQHPDFYGENTIKLLLKRASTFRGGDDICYLLFHLIAWSQATKTPPSEKMIRALLKKASGEKILYYSLETLAAEGEHQAEKELLEYFPKEELEVITREVLNIICPLINEDRISSFKGLTTFCFMNFLISINGEKISDKAFFQEKSVLLLVRRSRDLVPFDMLKLLFNLIGKIQDNKISTTPNLIQAFLIKFSPWNIMNAFFQGLESGVLKKTFFPHFSGEKFINVMQEVLHHICSLINEKTASRFTPEEAIDAIKNISSINQNKLKDQVFHEDKTLVLFANRLTRLKSSKIFHYLNNFMDLIEEGQIAPPYAFLNYLLARLMDEKNRIDLTPGTISHLAHKTAKLYKKTKYKLFEQEHIFNLLSILGSFNSKRLDLKDIHLTLWGLGILIEEGYLTELPDNIINNILKKLFKKDEITQELKIDKAFEIRYNQQTTRESRAYGIELVVALSNILFGVGQYMQLTQYNLDHSLLSPLIDLVHFDSVVKNSNHDNIRVILNALSHFKLKGVVIDLPLDAVDLYGINLYKELRNYKKKKSIATICTYLHSLAKLADAEGLREIPKESISKLVEEFHKCRSSAKDRDIVDFLLSLRILVNKDTIKKFRFKAYTLRGIVEQFINNGHLSPPDVCSIIQSLASIILVSSFSIKADWIQRLLDSVPITQITEDEAQQLLIGVGLLGVQVEPTSLLHELILRYRPPSRVNIETRVCCVKAYAKFYDGIINYNEETSYYCGFYYDLVVNVDGVTYLHQFKDSSTETEISKKRQQINDDLVRRRTQKVVTYTDLAGELSEQSFRVSIEATDRILNPGKYLLSKRSPLIDNDYFDLELLNLKADIEKEVTQDKMPVELTESENESSLKNMISSEAFLFFNNEKRKNEKDGKGHFATNTYKNQQILTKQDFKSYKRSGEPGKLRKRIHEENDDIKHEKTDISDPNIKHAETLSTKNSFN